MNRQLQRSARQQEKHLRAKSSASSVYKELNFSGSGEGWRRERRFDMEVVECYENDCFPFSGKKTNSDTVYFYIKGFFTSAIFCLYFSWFKLKTRHFTNSISPWSSENPRFLVWPGRVSSSLLPPNRKSPPKSPSHHKWKTCWGIYFF